jgi:hypothetical protein
MSKYLCFKRPCIYNLRKEEQQFIILYILLHEKLGKTTDNKVITNGFKSYIHNIKMKRVSVIEFYKRLIYTIIKFCYKRGRK